MTVIISSNSNPNRFIISYRSDSIDCMYALYLPENRSFSFLWQSFKEKIRGTKFSEDFEDDITLCSFGSREEAEIYIKKNLGNKREHEILEVIDTSDGYFSVVDA